MAGRIEPIRWAEIGGYAIAFAGVVAAVTFDAARSIFYTATAVMVIALTPVMLGFYELGGRTPRALALSALFMGVLAVFVFAALFLGLSAGLLTIDTTRPAEGPLAISSVAMVAFGLWLIAAPVLAGPWLSPAPRWLAAIWGGIGVQLLFPIWGLVIGRRFAAIRSLPAQRSGASESVG